MGEGVSAVLRGDQKHRYATTAEAAEVAGVSQKTVERWCRRGLVRTRDGHRPYQILRSELGRLKRDRQRG